MWTTAAIIAWLSTLGIGPGLTVNLKVVPGPYVPKMPDVVAVITTIGGLGESLDGAGDTPGFQVRIRGRQDPTNTDMSAEQAALTCDRLILRAPLPAVVASGVWLLPVQRSGGRPAPLPTPDAGDRVEFTCTYLTTIIT